MIGVERGAYIAMEIGRVERESEWWGRDATGSEPIIHTENFSLSRIFSLSANPI